MLNMNETNFRLTKASFFMGSWGLLILLAGCISQWFELPNPNYILLLWGGVSVLGIGAQLVGLVKGLELNLGIWIAVIVLGWAFTLYVIKFDNGNHMDLYGDQAGVWLILLGLGYVATAFQVDKRFLLIAALHILVGGLIELSARHVVSIDFLDSYSSLLVGLVGGLPLLVAALPVWYKEKSSQPVSNMNPQQRVGA